MLSASFIFSLIFKHYLNTMVYKVVNNTGVMSIQCSNTNPNTRVSFLTISPLSQPPPHVLLLSRHTMFYFILLYGWWNDHKMLQENEICEDYSISCRGVMSLSEGLLSCLLLVDLLLYCVCLLSSVSFYVNFPSDPMCLYWDVGIALSGGVKWF